ncbi:CRISPR-associated endonuclease Cas3'', partial [Streptomyces sp. MZ04]|uniref:CRISPR-associated endonuclease Cas3'' n=1 Tax=Streptomyces sp. MZ04 TaxID=2559236 RepID=UPI00107E74DD
APTRLDPAVLTLLTDSATATVIERAVARLRAGEDEDPAVIVHQLLDTLLHGLGTNPARPYADLAHTRLARLRAIAQWSAATIGRTRERGRIVLDPGEPARLLLLPPHTPQGQAEQTAGVGDDSADASSLTRPVSLSRHSLAVAQRSADFATALGLPTPLVDALRTAGHAHDCGKSHSRFQCMLCAGDRLLAESLDEPRAKSGMDPADRTGRKRAAQLAGWGPEMRHEALSALAVTAWLDTQPKHARGNDADLLVHLVAAHHGHARPLLPPAPDPSPQEVTCTMPDHQQITINSADMGTDWSGPDRFHALNRHYGPWGLALLEAVLRLADMACSEEGT